MLENFCYWLLGLVVPTVFRFIRASFRIREGTLAECLFISLGVLEAVFCFRRVHLWLGLTALKLRHRLGWHGRTGTGLFIASL